MKLKSIILATCLTATTLFIGSNVRAQTATPSPSSAPGDAPKFGPEKSGGRNGDHKGGPGGKRNPEERIAHLTEALSLTPDQVTKIRDIFKTEGDKMRAARKADKGAPLSPEQKKEKWKAAAAEVEASIRAVLTPEQQTKFDAMKKNRMEHGVGKGKKGPKGPQGPSPATTPDSTTNS